MSTPQMVSIAINGFIALFAIGAWLQIALGIGSADRLASKGKESLKYFTVLSNLLSCIVCGVYAIACIALGASAVPTWLLACKLMSATAVMLTFLVVIVLLGPRFGWAKMFKGGNFWMHGVLPLLAAIDCCLFTRVAALPLGITALGMLPTALYGAWYVSMLKIHGVEEDGRVYDFYAFARWGMEKMPIVVAGMLGVSWAIALVLWLCAQLFCVMG